MFLVKQTGLKFICLSSGVHLSEAVRETNVTSEHWSYVICYLPNIQSLKIKGHYLTWKTDIHFRPTSAHVIIQSFLVLLCLLKRARVTCNIHKKLQHLRSVHVSHFEVLEAESIRLVFEDVVPECSQHRHQQHWHQDGRCCATGVGVASGFIIEDLQRMSETNTQELKNILRHRFNNIKLKAEHSHSRATLCSTVTMETYLCAGLLPPALFTQRR